MTPARLIIAVLILFLTLFVISAPHLRDADPLIVTKERPMMGTIVEISVPLTPSVDPAAINNAIEKAFDEIERVEDLFSCYRKDSVISKINALGVAQDMVIPTEVFDLIERSIEFNKITEGAFDITVKPLVDLWSRAKSEKILPTDTAVAAALAKTGSRDIELNKQLSTILFKKDGMALDLGAVAKGYASDRAIEILKENGVGNAIVNSGGDMYCLGRRSKKHEWNVGIQHPRHSGVLAFELQLGGRAIDTSGDYEKFFTIDGKRFSHIIDPRTGYPIGDSVVSASVIAVDAATADILATALCILGRPGLMIASRHGADALIIEQDAGKFYSYMTEGFKSEYNVTTKSEL